MTELVLVRHAQPYGGSADPSLTPIGMEYAERAARWLAHDHVDVVLASPLRRARETAAPIAAAHGLDVLVHDGLMEWEAVPPRPVYIPLDEMGDDHPAVIALAEGRLDAFVPPFDHERFCADAALALADIFDRWPVERIVGVAHGGIINAMVSSIVQPAGGFFFYYPSYASFTILERMRGGRIVVRALSDTGHLLGERIAGRQRPPAMEG